MDCNTSGFPVLNHLPDLAQTHVHWVGDAIQPSCPLSSPSPPVLNLSQHQDLFQWVSSSHQAAKVLELQLQHQSFQWIFRTCFLYDWLVWSYSRQDSQESLQHHNLKTSVLQCSAFFMVQFSHPYMTTRKTIALTLWNFVNKVMSLLFNMLSRFVITFLRSNRFLSLYSFLSVSYFIVLSSKEQALLFTKVVASFDIPTSNVWEFQLLHILLNTWYYQTFFF